MDTSPPCLESKLSKVSEQSSESHSAAATAAAVRDELEALAVDNSEETLCVRE